MNISNVAISHLSSVLRGDSYLTYLDLSSTNLDSTAFVDLAKGLSHNTLLKKLNLSFNNAQSTGAKAIVEALIDNEIIPIETFGLAENQIGTDGREAIIKLIEKNKPRLKNLYIELNGWTNSKEISAKLIQSVIKNDYLEDILTGPLDVSPSQLRQTEQAKPWLNFNDFRLIGPSDPKHDKMWHK